MFTAHKEDTICALSTAPGMGAIAVVRVSGSAAFSIVDQVFSKRLETVVSHSLHYGVIKDGDRLIDEVVCSVFRGPHSFTGENVVEISCHGSVFIQQQLIELLLAKGCRMAEPGEFTLRAFYHQKMDLAQAEAVADLIASGSAAAHRLALSQMRGGVSGELQVLRQKLLDFTSLIELELDFSEEDVAFADRTQFKNLIRDMLVHLTGLIQSFSYGNALKNGVPTTIIGLPNAGKSTLLNALLRENRAIVSEIAGTTRDVIEDRLVIDGIEFRLQDTAGVRKTTHAIEAEGVFRSEALAKKAALLLYVFDPGEQSVTEAELYLQKLQLPEATHIIYVANKIDLLDSNPYQGSDVVAISAKEGTNLEALRDEMTRQIKFDLNRCENDVVITNVRHIHALKKSFEALTEVERGLETGLTGDLMAIDIRTALHHLGEITGEISTDEVLGNIFGRFCIGK